MRAVACTHRGTFYIQYETMEELGEGAFGKALKCRRRRDNQIFVVKIMHESKMSAKAIEEVTLCCPTTNPIKLKETPDNMVTQDNYPFYTEH